jgi:hypothetical protein
MASRMLPGARAIENLSRESLLPRKTSGRQIQRWKLGVCVELYVLILFHCQLGNIVLPVPNGATMGSAGEFRPGKLWSLWDIMINFKFGEAYGALELLNVCCKQALERALNSRLKMKGGLEFASDQLKEEAATVLLNCHSAFSPLGSRNLTSRMLRFREALGRQLTLDDLESEYRFLRELIQNEIKYHYFYRYSETQAERVNNFDEDWADVISAFSSARDDAFAAVDCVALEHGTAAVFHSMRVLEKGLRALAADVGRTYDRQMWGGIIDEIESEITKFRKTAPAGVPKDERLRFLSEAAKEFSYFKNAWRNHVSHGGDPYDADQAMAVVNHVKSFMSILSTKLSE